MKKKGFTLIELLAVIVVLAIVALVAVPIILNVVETSKKGAKESDVLGYVDAVEKQVMLAQVDSTANKIDAGTYTVAQLTKVDVKGEKPAGTSILIIGTKGRVTEGWFTFDNSNYKVYYDGKYAVASTGNDYLDKDGNSHNTIPEPGSSVEADPSVVVYSTASSGITQESEGVADYNTLDRLVFIKYTFLNGEITKKEACGIIGNDTGKLLCLDPNGLSNHEEYSNQFGDGCSIYTSYGVDESLNCSATFTRSGVSYTTYAQVRYDGEAYFRIRTGPQDDHSCSINSDNTIDCY